MDTVDLEKLIAQMFPLSMFGHEEHLETAIKAYAQGFKDAYAKNADNVTINVVRGQTARELLLNKILQGDNRATNKEGTTDSSSDGEVLREGER